MNFRSFCVVSLALIWAVASGAQAGPEGESDETSGSRVVWVLFKDKNVASGPQSRAALEEKDQWISQRAHGRRSLRGSHEIVGAPWDTDLQVSPDYVQAVLATGARKRHVSRWLNALTVEATQDQVARIALLPFVREVHDARRSTRGHEPPPDWVQAAPREMLHLTAINYGPSFGQLQQSAVPAAHASGYNGTGVVVGLLDTGFYKTHECLSSRALFMEHDFVFNDGDVQRDLTNPQDYSDAHGTSTWSVLGGFREGTMIGVAFNATFVLGKTEDLRSETPVEEDNWVAAIEWMEANGVDVVSSSLAYLTFDGGGGYSFSDLDGLTAKTTLAADMASSLGVVVCNAIGNGGPGLGTLAVPADAFGVVSCGAVNSAGNAATFSSRGPTADGRIKPEACARGEDCRIATNTGPTAYTIGNGTSYACPIVAGVAALVVQAHPTWSPATIREALMQTASNHAALDNALGWGIVNTVAAINYTPASSVDEWQLYQP